MTEALVQDSFKDPKLARELIDVIAVLAGRIDAQKIGERDRVGAAKHNDGSPAFPPAFRSRSLPRTPMRGSPSAAQMRGGRLSLRAPATVSARGDDKENVSANAGTINIMEVCGTHTVAIARAGFRSIMPPNIKLISGPGCPVCVTANVDIDRIIAASRLDGVIVATFGDMIRVPGSTTSLQERKAQGARIEVVYSPLDALKLAQEHPDVQVIFVGVGFETTTPLVAATIKRAKALGLANFSVIGAQKQVPPALTALANDSEVALDALILPGHVSTIIGVKPYEFVARDYGIPGVITGFEPVDVLQGIAELLKQLAIGKAQIEIAYKRAVMQEGNPAARAAIAEVFEPCDATWRGLGLIPNSGYKIRGSYKRFDASQRFASELEQLSEPTIEPRGCRCGSVLRGVIAPPQCPLFNKPCTPTNPIGSCMVSSEGSCAAYWRYQI